MSTVGRPIWMELVVEESWGQNVGIEGLWEQGSKALRCF